LRYAVVIEGEMGSYSAYVPDLPGCAVAGDTIEEVMREMPEAIRFHIEGLQEDGLPVVPEPSIVVDYVET
jgi:predicted RNase H-like HicB family nuclease